MVNPYPKKYETSWKLHDGRTIILRSIKPEDATLWVEMFQKFSEESKRYRFFENIKDTSPEVIARYCNINYDKEIAIVAELKEEEQRRILGVVRLVVEPDAKTGEIAFIVADPWQGLGLGWKMVEYMIEICKDKELETIYALILRDNHRAIKLVKEMRFSIEYSDQETVKATLNLREEPKREQSR